MSKILYHERKSARTQLGPMNSPITDYVEVMVRYWHAARMGGDIVIAWQVMVDGKVVVDCRKAHEPDEPDAAFARMGITKFDELLGAHPRSKDLAYEGDGSCSF